MHASMQSSLGAHPALLRSPQQDSFMNESLGDTHSKIVTSMDDRQRVSLQQNDQNGQMQQLHKQSTLAANTSSTRMSTSPNMTLL